MYTFLTAFHGSCQHWVDRISPMPDLVDRYSYQTFENHCGSPKHNHFTCALTNGFLVLFRNFRWSLGGISKTLTTYQTSEFCGFSHLKEWQKGLLIAHLPHSQILGSSELVFTTSAVYEWRFDDTIFIARLKRCSLFVSSVSSLVSGLVLGGEWYLKSFAVCQILQQRFCSLL